VVDTEEKAARARAFIIADIKKLPFLFIDTESLVLTPRERLTLLQKAKSNMMGSEKSCIDNKKSIMIVGTGNLNVFVFRLEHFGYDSRKALGEAVLNAIEGGKTWPEGIVIIGNALDQEKSDNHVHIKRSADIGGAMNLMMRFSKANEVRNVVC
jgi:hypothetical protein